MLLLSLNSRRLPITKPKASRINIHPIAGIVFSLCWICFPGSQPRCPAHATGIAVYRWPDLSRAFAAKNILRQPPRQGLVEFRYIAHATAQHNHVWVQKIDNRCQALGQMLNIEVQRYTALAISVPCAGNYFLCRGPTVR